MTIKKTIALSIAALMYSAPAHAANSFWGGFAEGLANSQQPGYAQQQQMREQYEQGLYEQQQRYNREQLHQMRIEQQLREMNDALNRTRAR